MSFFCRYPEIIRNGSFMLLPLFAFSVFVLFYNLAGRHLESWDEAYYVLMGHLSILKESYLLLYESPDKIHWSKTPFALFPMIALFKIYGINEISARLASAFFGLGLLAQIFLVARKFYGPWTALLSVFVALTINQLIFDHGLKTANVDAMTLFFLFGSVTCWLIIKNRTFRAVTAGACLGFAFLCKGPIVSIPLAVIAASLFIGDRDRNCSWKTSFLLSGTAAAIIAPWYGFAFAAHGLEFVHRHIFFNFIQRYVTGVEGHLNEEIFFLRILLSPDNFIWIGCGILSLVYFLKKYSGEKRYVDFVLLSWVLASFFIVSQCQTKLCWYILPVYPAAAIMVARTLEDFIEHSDYLNSVAYYAGLLIVAIFLFDQELFPESRSNMTKGFLLVLSVFLVRTRMVSTFPALSKKINLFLVGILCLFPLYRTYESVMKVTRSPVSAFAERLPDSVSLNSFQLRKSDPGAFYYLQKRFQVREYEDSASFSRLKGQLVVTRNETLKMLSSETFRISPLLEMDGYSLVRIERLK